MKKFCFIIIGVLVSLFLINNLTASLSEPKEGSIILDDETWQDVDGMPMKNSYVSCDHHYGWSKFATHLIFLNRRIKAQAPDKSIAMNDLYERGVDDIVPSIPSDNILRMTDAIYSYAEKSSGIYTTPHDDGYYHQTIQLEFTESLPAAINRMFGNHYIYFQTDSGQLIAQKLNLFPLNSILPIIVFVLFIFGLFAYQVINGINFHFGLLLGLIYSAILVSFDIISIIYPVIIFVILLISLYLGFKLKIWGLSKKLLSNPLLIIAGIAYVLAYGYLCFNNDEFSKINLAYLCIFFLLGAFLFYLLIYDIARIFKILASLLFGHKTKITKLQINSIRVQTYRRSPPQYFTSLCVNNQLNYYDAGCTLKIYIAHKNAHQINCTSMYSNRNKDMIIL